MRENNNRTKPQSTNRVTKPESTQFKVTSETELLVFLLAKITQKSRNDVKVLLRDKQIFVDGKPITQFNHPLKPEQIVEVKWKKGPEEQKYRGLNIVFEDQYIIVIEKQAGVLSIATEKQKDNTAYSILSGHVKKQSPSNRIFVVHRLDRETSGLMMFAKSEKVQKLLQESWNATIEERTYLAVVEGYVQKKEDTIISYLVESKALIVYSNKNSEVGQKAITHYEVLKSNKNYSLLKVNLETGRKNQIRVHAKDIGHPVVGDNKYGATQDPIKRLGLHAWILSFKHPITGKQLSFETEMPTKFVNLFG
ncbi:Ribosomal large subunit pseudouridine synthase D [Emticicia aquatica]|uniref:Pseudouridine synthase n=1 Tax=Emticicia aquatica TaxID=1681835 RepID=A0ABM9AJM8_9BACT|nr:RluA family pseudouridine synthase [Emticicia aquatica]CAH0993905.1 Ribosomal large subunit pseudouridine synthase D [Emticicia aquatica]